MTDDQTKCPHCGADRDVSFVNCRMYKCGTTSGTVFTRQSLSCEIDSLRAKVAAQQELLREVLACGCSWKCEGKYAELQVPLDLITKIREVVEE